MFVSNYPSITRIEKEAKKRWVSPHVREEYTSVVGKESNVARGNNHVSYYYEQNEIRF